MSVFEPIDLKDVKPGDWLTRAGWRLPYQVHKVDEDGETVLFENGPRGVPERFSAKDGWFQLISFRDED